MKDRRLSCLAVTLVLATAIASIPARAQSSGSLVVLNKAEATLAIVDPASAKVVAKVPTGDGPHEVAISSDGKRAYVTNYGAQTPGSSLSIVDLDARKEIKRVDLGAIRRPHGIFEHDGKVYFTTETSCAVARYDPAADRVDWIMGTGQLGTHMLVLSPDKKRIYTANIGSDSVSLVELEPGPGRPPVRHVAVGKNPEGLDISPDGKELWVGQNGDGGLSVVDTATLAVTATVKVGKVPIRVKFAPDGKRVFVTDPEAGGRVVFDAATRAEGKRGKIEGGPVGLGFWADGSRLFVAAAAANRAMVFDATSLEPVASVETGAGPDGLGFRP
jgi:YVTN family beta-propeller protein